MILGVTGKYCAGKNHLCKKLESKGLYVIDVDLLGHQALAHLETQVVDCFGDDVLDDGKISRVKLGKVVFSDPVKLKLLESIVHPWMIQKTMDLIETEKPTDSVINAAVLFTMGLDKFCDKVIIVEASLIIRIIRALKRDKISIFKILSRIWTQRKLYSKSIRNHSDIYTIESSGKDSNIAGLLDKLNIVNQ